MATLHAACFSVPRPWSSKEFSELLENPSVFSCASGAGFILGRVIADEAELLTLAVAPDQRRRGIGQMLLTQYEACATQRNARVSFLEVAANNRAAIALYRTARYRESGRRKGYYCAPDGQKTDALLFSKPLKPV